MSLTEAWQAEQCVSREIRHTIPEILYAHFRRRLETIASDDEQHAYLLQEPLKGFGVMMAEHPPTLEEARHPLPSSPWRRLQHALREKRELYEIYRREASAVDDPELRSLLERFRDDEERHQEQLIGILMQLDAHMHDTIT
jgi:rubrerythrin